MNRLENIQYVGRILEENGRDVNERGKRAGVFLMCGKSSQEQRLEVPQKGKEMLYKYQIVIITYVKTWVIKQRMKAEYKHVQ